MNIKTFFSKVLLAAAFVFLTISVALATEVDVTVNVTGNGTVSYENKSASDGSRLHLRQNYGVPLRLTMQLLR